jgi:hypothetical protein
MISNSSRACDSRRMTMALLARSLSLRGPPQMKLCHPTFARSGSTATKRNHNPMSGRTERSALRQVEHRFPELTSSAFPDSKSTAAAVIVLGNTLRAADSAGLVRGTEQAQSKRTLRPLQQISVGFATGPEAPVQVCEIASPANALCPALASPLPNERPLEWSRTPARARLLHHSLQPNFRICCRPEKRRGLFGQRGNAVQIPNRTTEPAANQEAPL